ncbi:RNA polymerase sigma factor [Pontibacter sp. SGAir0037]|uniref:RNA polymerase sigma factor n=1 Tax=Pontibacter sp. SGAir0037 TaxID=2571030 RepID=UPI0010CD07AE|nr:sigma-70 family RNA polymerase sigma factor [Pontibacter sp. SGAir0037]QCR23037.1 sigma-70 family RNA polymerase sigma factor [Pontibacter sp. SGAir0037]
MKGLANEEIIWDNFRAGSEEAYALIYETYSSILYSYGCSLNHDKELVKDCLQDLFVNLWHKRTSLGPTNSIKYYLFRSLRRELVRTLRQRSIVMEASDTLTEYSAEDRWIGSEDNSSMKRMLENALSKLSERQREAIYLRFFQSMEFEDIARIMDITPRAVYKLIYRAIDVLHKNYFPAAQKDSPALLVSYPEFQLYLLLLLFCISF